jgi:hypothetical protein
MDGGEAVHNGSGSGDGGGGGRWQVAVDEDEDGGVQWRQQPLMVATAFNCVPQ